MINRINKIRGGFTLVEVLIAMAIFMIFSGILISSYGSIVKSQREANEYRLMYSEAGTIFDTLVREFRDGMVDYVHYVALNQTVDDIYLVRKDGMAKTHIYLSDEQELWIERGELATGSTVGEDPAFSVPIVLNNKVKVKNIKFYITPVIDPYDVKNVKFDLNQFHPKVTILADFERMVNGKTFTITLQTTISSRIYNQVYKPQL